MVRPLRAELSSVCQQFYPLSTVGYGTKGLSEDGRPFMSLPHPDGRPHDFYATGA